MTVTLTSTNVVGEDVELVVKDSHVIDIVVELGGGSLDIDSAEPVESKSSQDIGDWFTLINSSVKDSLNLISLIR